MDEKKLREKLTALLEKKAYGSLHTFRREPLINAIVAAVKESEETTAPELLVGSEEEEEEDDE